MTFSEECLSDGVLSGFPQFGVWGQEAMEVDLVAEATYTVELKAEPKYEVVMVAESGA